MFADLFLSQLSGFKLMRSQLNINTTESVNFVYYLMH